MPQILNKGHTYATGDQVTSSNLNSLVDAATFASTCVVSGGGLELSGGALQIADGTITDTKLSSGAPDWTVDTVAIPQHLTVQNTIVSGGNISTSGNLAVNGTAAITGDATLSGTIIRAGTTPNRTVRLQTAATSGNANAISFGFDNGDLLVTVDLQEFRITMTPV